MDFANAAFTLSIVSASAFNKTAGRGLACAVVWQAVIRPTQNTAQYRNVDSRIITDLTSA